MNSRTSPHVPKATTPITTSLGVKPRNLQPAAKSKSPISHNPNQIATSRPNAPPSKPSVNLKLRRQQAQKYPSGNRLLSETRNEKQKLINTKLTNTANSLPPPQDKVRNSSIAIPTIRDVVANNAVTPEFHSSHKREVNRKLWDSNSSVNLKQYLIQRKTKTLSSLHLKPYERSPLEPASLQAKVNRNFMTKVLNKPVGNPKQSLEKGQEADRPQTANRDTQTDSKQPQSSATPEKKQEQASEVDRDRSAKAPTEKANTKNKTSASKGKEQSASSKSQDAEKKSATNDSKIPKSDRQSEAAKTPASPEEDPGFQAVANAVAGVANREQAHNPAKNEAAAALSAARSPSNEVTSQAQSQQAGVMDRQQPGQFNDRAFKAALLGKIEQIIPDTEEEAQDFGNNNELDSVRDEVSSQVSEEQERATGSIQDATEAEPDTSGIEPRTATNLEPQPIGTATTNVGAERAAPPPKADAEVTKPLAANVREIDSQMNEANVTETQLANSNEPEFQQALDARQEVQSHASQAPATYRQEERGIISETQANAQNISQQQLEVMHGDRANLLGQVANQQAQTQTQDEGKRTEVATHINGIYERTKADVENVLSSLDGEVTSKFDAAAAQAKQLFEGYVAQKMDAWSEERYGEWYDVTGYDERISDAWSGLPPEVNQFFVLGKQKYIKAMDVALTDIANHVASKLNEAKTCISQGRQQIQEYVSSLPRDLQEFGRESAENIQSRFDELEDSVNSKQDELIDSLAQRYSNSLGEVNARITEMQEANKGLKDKAMDAIGGVIETILKLKQMISNVLSQAGDAVDRIIEDPIGFLGNLIAGVKQGFDSFVGKIWDHLQSGLIGWLTGALGAAGIQIPDNLFSLSGIFDLITQILGMTWSYIRNKAVKMFGEPVVAAMEQAVEIFQIFQTEGIMGIWEYIKESFNDLKESVIDQIKDMVITQVITAGVKWILSLLNPASAFVKAAMAIYDIVMFFVNQGSQILSLVRAFIEGIGAVAKGSVGVIAQKIEEALVRALPVVIGFLASLLGVSGLADKVQDIVGAIRQRVDDAIESILNKVKKLFKRKKGKGDTDSFTEQDKAKGLAAFEKEEQPFIKDNAISQENARQVAGIVKRKHPVFKEISVVDGRDSWDYEYVFRAIDTTTKKASDEKVDISELENWNPSWRVSTNRKLMKRDEALFELNDSGKPRLKNPEDYDRRHIVAFNVILSNLTNMLAGKTIEQAYESLSNQGYKPKNTTNADIIKACKKYLQDHYNNEENIWVGDSKENQKLGSKIGNLLNKLERVQNELRGLKGASQESIDTKRPRLTQEITNIVKGLQECQLDVPPGKTVAAAKKYLDMLRVERKLTLNLLKTLRK